MLAVPGPSGRALLTILTIVLTGCGTAVTSGTATPGDSPVASATPQATSSGPSPTASPSEAAGPIEQQVGGLSPFSITTPADWEIDTEMPVQVGSGFRIGPDRWVTVSTEGPDSVDGWLARFDEEPWSVVAGPEPVDIGGAPGYVLDLTLESGNPPVMLFGNPLAAWEVASGRPNRLWVLDVDGETVIIVTDAPERPFESWATEVEEALGTLEWGE